MSWKELNNITGKNAFNPETAEVEAMPLFVMLKERMSALGWVYDGSLRWSVNSQLIRVVFVPGECAVLELWHTDGSNDLLRRIGTDCDEKGLIDALEVLGISGPLKEIT